MRFNCISSLPSWPHDISAGIVVFLVALPLCLGIALASGAPIVAGLLSGIVGGVLVGALSGSHTSVSGPAAGLTAIIAAQIVSLGSFDTFLCAVLIAGIIQIFMGLARTGFIAAFFPNSVIKGLLAAIGVIMVLKQLPHLGGLDVDFEGDMAFIQRDHENTFSEIVKLLTNFHLGALIVGILSLALLVLWEKTPFLKKLRIPAPLVVVVVGTLVGLLLSDSWMIESEHKVQVPFIKDFASLSQLFSIPDFSRFFEAQVMMAGVTLAIIASSETLLNLEAMDKIDPEQRVSPPNRELIAQGMGNVVLGLIGGLPVTSVVIRGSVNINANAKSKWSTIIHGFLLFFSVVFLPFALNLIPLSCLAAILIVTGIKLVSPKIIRLMWSQGWNQFLPFSSTLLAIIFTDLLMGILIGLIVSLFFILKSNLSNQNRLILENHLGRSIRRIVLANQVSFLNKAALSRILADVPNNSQLIIDANDTEYIDADVFDMLKDFEDTTATARHITLSLVGFKNSYVLQDSINFVDHATWELQQNATPDQVLRLIQEGNQRAREDTRLKRDFNRQILATATGQYPLAVILSCIDSRVPVELVFDLGIGDVFSIRMAGNVTSEKVLGSLEFACISGAKLIVVMGHTRCGAISATVDAHLGRGGPKNYECHHLQYIVREIAKVIPPSWPPLSLENLVVHDDIITDFAKRNVLQSINNIKNDSHVIANFLAEGQIGIAGCIYDISTGRVDFIAHDKVDAANIFNQRTKEKDPLAEDTL